MKSRILLLALLVPLFCLAQNVEQSLTRAFIDLENDAQFRHALVGMYVTNKSGKIIYQKNGDIGMAPASTLKIVTSISSFELLGKDFQFKTGVAVNTEVKNGELGGNLFFVGGSDPTLGSNRWASTKPEKVYQKIRSILDENKIKKINGVVAVDDNRFSYPPIPTGWIWEDVGNYYGAGAWALNWLENKYAVHFKSGSGIGQATEVLATSPASIAGQITNQVVAAAKGTGDNAYLFSAPYSNKIFATGTIPAASDKFTIYGAMPDPHKIFISDINQALKDMLAKSAGNSTKGENKLTIIGNVYSPPLDSVNYWFLRESVNLFGEALVMNIALAEGKKTSTATGVQILRDFWLKYGISKAALKMIDGSGLSPANRVTPKALVQILSFARSKSWFQSFHYGLPELNGIKMKSGYIGGVRSYAGYINSKSGEEYTFAFIINNFDGAASSVREKMYKLLNLLK